MKGYVQAADQHREGMAGENSRERREESRPGAAGLSLHKDAEVGRAGLSPLSDI